MAGHPDRATSRMTDDRRLQPNRPAETGYAGVGITFGRVPLVLSPEGLEGADVAIVGAPFDEGVSYRPGTRFGPRAIRTAEDAAFPTARPNMELGIDPYAELDVVDYGDVDVRAADLAHSHRALEASVSEILAAGATPIVLGGDHSLSTPVLAALAARFGADGFSVVHFDTHADTGADEAEAPHGVPFHRAVIDGHLRGENIVQIGLRGAWPFPEDFRWMREAGFRWHTMGEVIERGIAAVTRDAIAHARSRAPRTYLTVDIDVLDPGHAPGTGTAEPGGLLTRELLWAVRTVACELDLCCMDMVEVSPPYDQSGITAMAANRVVLETLGGIALRRSGRPARPERPGV
jgi:agmatinase